MESTLPANDPAQLRFARHHAFIIGINAYQHASPLQTAVGDAQELARVLSAQQHFSVHPPLLDASGADMRTLLRETLDATVGPKDRVLFYFAGHGISVDGDDGPAGYLLPADAELDDPDSFVSMTELQRSLEALPCRHLLLILDCCFSGAFKWSSGYRAAGNFMPKKIYQERFDRFVADPAWQVITSAAHDQKALDVVRGIGRATGARGTAQHDAAHSPFAKALFDGLAGAADAKGDIDGDGVITATELYLYVRDQVEPRTLESGQRYRQTPGFFPLKKHDKGEFIFLHPRHRLNLPPMPNRSPYKGLASFEEEDQLLFYGRDRVVEELRAKSRVHPLLVVSGASGTGKSSVIKAGLLPLLRAEGFQILPVIRPGAHPMAELDGALQALDGDAKAVLLIDQYEELLTRCADPDERAQFDARLAELLAGDARLRRIVITVRADFEPQLNRGALKDAWQQGRCTVPPFSLEELKEVIVMPTIQEVLVFEPPEMVEAIVGEVVQSPGALPLLSYALSELYEAYRSSKRLDRKLTEGDYARLGGVMGALRTKADALYGQLSKSEQDMMRKLMLRMVSVEGDWASRRVPMEDLGYGPQDEAVVTGVIEQLVQARLIVKGEGFIEPAHDALIRAWPTLREWVHAATPEMLILGGKLNASANEFLRSGDVDFLWNANPNLQAVEREAAHPRHWFNAKEVAFIRKSAARKKRRFHIGVIVTSGIVLALSALTLLAWQQTGTARLERDRTLVQLLASQARRAVSNVQSEGEVELGAALAVASIRLAHASRTGPAEPDALEAARGALNLLPLETIGADGQYAHRLRVADGRLVSYNGKTGVIWLWPKAGKDKPVELTLGKLSTPMEDEDLAVLSDGSIARFVYHDRAIRVWPKDGRSAPTILSPALGPLLALADGRLASGGSGGTIQIWPTAGGGPPLRLVHGSEAKRLAQTTDGRLASAGEDRDGTIKVWDLTGQVPPQVLKHGGPVGALSARSDGGLTSVGKDDLGTIRFWPRGGIGQPIDKQHGSGIGQAVALADGRLATMGEEIKVWPADPQQAPIVLRHDAATRVSITVLADGRLATGGGFADSGGGMIKIWPQNGDDEPIVWKFPKAVLDLARLPDGRWASLGLTGPIKIWHPAGQGEPQVLPSGEMADGAEEAPLEMPLARLLGVKGGTLSQAFENGRPDWLGGAPDNHGVKLPDGRVATFEKDKLGTTLRIKLSTPDGSAEPVSLNPGSEVGAMLALPDGRLATSSFGQYGDGTIKLWPKSGRGDPEVLPTQEGGPLRVLSDGRLASWYGPSISLWIVDDEQLIAALCLRAGRNLSKIEWARYFGADTPWQPGCGSRPSNWRTDREP